MRRQTPSERVRSTIVEMVPHGNIYRVENEQTYTTVKSINVKSCIGPTCWSLSPYPSRAARVQQAHSAELLQSYSSSV